MERKIGLVSSELLARVTELMETGGNFEDGDPAVLSCGGLYLRGRKLPKRLLSWQTQIYLPKTERFNIRVIRMCQDSSRRSLSRVIKLEDLV